MLAAGVLTGCAGNGTASNADSTPAVTESAPAGETPSSNAPEAAHEFDFDDSIVRVTVDLSEGWAVEFGKMATYLYDRPVDDAKDYAACGVYMDQETYDQYLSEYQSKETFTKGENGAFTYMAEDTHYFVSKIADGTYFSIMVPAADNSEEISQRFKAVYVSEAVTAPENNADGFAAQAEHSVTVSGNVLDVRVELKNGWSASFGDMAAYLYDVSLDAEDEAIAWATFIEQADYDEFLEDNSGKDTFVQNGDAVEYTNEDGMMRYISPVKDGLYFDVTVSGAENPAAVRDCFSYTTVVDSMAE